MRCKQCGWDVPDFLWVGNDHPVLIDHPITVRRQPLADDRNQIRVTMEAYIGVEMCGERDLSQIKLSEELIQSMVEVSGLKGDTLRDLMEKGWTYRKEIGQPDRLERIF